MSAQFMTTTMFRKWVFIEIVELECIISTKIDTIVDSIYYFKQKKIQTCSKFQCKKCKINIIGKQ